MSNVGILSLVSFIIICTAAVWCEPPLSVARREGRVMDAEKIMKGLSPS